MRHRIGIAGFLPVFVWFFLAALASLPGAAHGVEAEFALVVRSEGREITLSTAEIAKLPRASVRAKDEKGKEGVWEGTPLHEVLKAAGMKLGEAIRGNALANYLVVEAQDGYRVIFTLPEVDPAFSDLIFLLADRRDGKPMNEYEGKLRIVVPHEKRHARWVRNVARISLQRAQ